jgi:hypothetical protein
MKFQLLNQFKEKIYQIFIYKDQFSKWNAIAQACNKFLQLDNQF